MGAKLLAALLVAVAVTGVGVYYAGFGPDVGEGSAALPTPTVAGGCASHAMMCSASAETPSTCGDGLTESVSDPSDAVAACTGGLTVAATRAKCGHCCEE